MSFDQIFLFALFVAVFVFLIWGRFRYDLVAFTALILATVVGVVPREAAFAGFGHPATIVVAIVLVISRGLVNSGAVAWIVRIVVDSGRSLGSHIAIMATIGAGLSAFMNNVAALALLMPVELSASTKAGRRPGLSLMPLAFATILGGLVTLIGTPPNIIIATFRQHALGQGFAMFDFAPVGIACAVVGVAYVALIGWRLIPVRETAAQPSQDLRKIHGYVAELDVPEGSPAIGREVRDLDNEAEEAGVVIIGLVRGGRRLAGAGRRVDIAAGDVLIVDGTVQAIDALTGTLKLGFPDRARIEEESGGEMGLVEAVVTQDSRLDGHSVASVGLSRLHNVSLLGVSRQGQSFRQRVCSLAIQPGDVLLLIGPSERLAEAVQWLGALPLADRGLAVTRHGRAAFAAGIFALAVALAATNLVYLPVALAAVVIAYVSFDIVPLRQLYQEIEWPVIVLLGSMIPLGTALESSGGTTLIANGLLDLAAGWPAWAVLTLLMLVVMALSDVLNNTATAVIGAPIALDIATRLGVSPDPFLMAVAVAASCAFLTPIGHKNNTLVLGPGGYTFADYWRMGLPLEAIIVVVAVPTILVVWPFTPA